MDKTYGFYHSGPPPNTVSDSSRSAAPPQGTSQSQELPSQPVTSWKEIPRLTALREALPSLRTNNAFTSNKVEVLLAYEKHGELKIFPDTTTFTWEASSVFGVVHTAKWGFDEFHFRRYDSKFGIEYKDLVKIRVFVDGQSLLAYEMAKCRRERKDNGFDKSIFGAKNPVWMEKDMKVQLYFVVEPKWWDAQGKPTAPPQPPPPPPPPPRGPLTLRTSEPGPAAPIVYGSSSSPIHIQVGSPSSAGGSGPRTPVQQIGTPPPNSRTITTGQTGTSGSTRGSGPGGRGRGTRDGSGSTRGGSTRGGSTRGGSTRGGSTRGGSTRGGSTRGGGTRGGGTRGGSTRGGP